MRRLPALLALILRGDGCNVFGEDDPVFRSAAWVRAWAAAGNVTLLDARDSFGGHVRGAAHARWQQFAQGGFGSPDGGLLRPEAELQASLRALGVGPGRAAVAYGDWSAGWGAEGRIHWMLRLLGLQDAFILAGGLPAYAALYPGDLTDDTEAPVPAPAWDTSRLAPLPSARETKAGIQAGAPFLVDVRAPGEYDGSMRRPYGVSRDGHAASAVSFPFAELFEGGCLRSCDEIRDRLESLGWTPGRRIAAYCTGGIRSGFFWSAVGRCPFGEGAVANYDGSMWEWAADASLPMSGGGAAARGGAFSPAVGCGAGAAALAALSAV